MDRILTTHTGSLIRPPALATFVRAIDRGEPYDRAALATTLTAAVAATVAQQMDTGIDVVDDGEMGKVSWITYLYDRVSGIEPREASLAVSNTLPQTLDPEAFSEFYAGNDVVQGAESVDEGAGANADVGRIWVCTGPIRYDGGDADVDIANLKAALEGTEVVDAFLPAVSPASVYWLRNEHYDSDEDLVFAIADALGEEYRKIVAAGLMLQVDDAVMWHKLTTMRLRGETTADYHRWAELRIEALNRALTGIPPERVRYHLCAGSWHGAHTLDPALADIVDLVLRVNARYLMIEQANARHEHEWQLWQDVALPEDKVLVPGVVTHHTQMVEHPELVAQRLVRVAEVVGRERVMASTDCGFAQSAFIQRVPVSTQWAKLQSLVDGARLASERLWPQRTRTASA